MDAGEDIRTRLSSLPGVSIASDAAIEQVGYYLRLPARVSSEGRDHLLAVQEVIALEPIEEVELEGETANLIIAGHADESDLTSGSYLDWLKRYNLSGSGTTIGIVDTGVDTEHEAFANRISDQAHGRKGWHGTFVAGCAAGDYRQELDPNGKIGGLGVAPQANIISISNSGVTASPSTKCAETVNKKGPNGVEGYIQNNSWGAGTANPMNYTSLEASYDKLVRNADSSGTTPKPLIICFSSGNRGNKGLTRPKSAKNVIVTGNSESLQDIGGAFSDNKDDVYFDESWQPSSVGNCGDQRVRPHVVAPGEWTLAANYGMKPGSIEYFSPKLTWCGGSSAASPKTAGACALLVDWWKQNNSDNLPSPAMVRALIVNGAAPMRKSSRSYQNSTQNSFHPNIYSGWGRLNLKGTIEDEVRRFYLDQSTILSDRGEKWEMDFVADDPTQAVKITLTWTDPPGSIYSGDSLDNPAIVNRILLKAESNGQNYLGNNFDRGWSVAGQYQDRRLSGIDNTQNIFFPPGSLPKSFTLSVEALEVTTNCFDFSPINPAQDFALVVHNASPVDRSDKAPLCFFFDPVRDQSSNSEELNEEELIDWYWEETYDEFDDSSWWITEDDFDWYNQVDNVETRTRPKLEQLTRKELATMAILGTESIYSVANENGTREFHSLSSFLQALKHREIGSAQDIVLGIHPNTQVTTQDIKYLREICFSGNLYLVSSSAEALVQFTHLLNREKGIHLRYAKNADELMETYQDALIESKGGLPTHIHRGIVKLEGEAYKALGIDSTIMDDKIVVHIELPSTEQESMGIIMPDQQVLQFNPYAEELPDLLEGMSCRRDETELYIEIDLSQNAGLPKGGRWTIATQSSPKSAKAWVWAEQFFSASLQQDHRPMNVGDNSERLLLLVDSQSNVQFSQVEVIPSVISRKPASPQDLESEKRLQIRPLARTGLNGVSTESQPIRLSKTLSKWIKFEREQDDSLILELILRLSGVDQQGNAFQRIAVLSKIDIQQRKQQSMPIQLRQFEAKVVKMYYQEGSLKAVRLASKWGQRDFKIPPGDLSDSIEELATARENLAFTTKGTKIVAITHFLFQDRENS